jgi:hypothetical protein
MIGIRRGAMLLITKAKLDELVTKTELKSGLTLLKAEVERDLYRVMWTNTGVIIGAVAAIATAAVHLAK